MSSDDYGNLAYLGILAAAALAWFITNHRESFGKTMQQMLAWVLIFLGVVAAAGMWEDIRNRARPTQAVMSDAGSIIIGLSPDGHYRATLKINDVLVEFIVDTGASDMVLTQDDARKIGFNPAELNYTGIALTANGEVRTAPVWLKTVQLGDVSDTNVPARVNGGELDQSLLGMSYLRYYDQITITRGQLVLTR
jgi:aspartyl protease family protein